MQGVTQPRRWTRSAVVIVAAIALNIGLGYLVQQVLLLPLYMDSVGTVIVGALLGPLAGALTGAASNLLWGLALDHREIMPYAITAAFIGWAAAFSAQNGAFTRWYKAIGAGILTGIASAIISAPITAYVFGGITEAGTDYVVSLIQQSGANVLQAATVQGFISDPVDKAVAFFVAWAALLVLRRYFPAPPARRGWQIRGYSAAVLLSLVSVAIALLFEPAIGASGVFIFYLAVLLAALAGGLGPGLLTMAVGAITGVLLLTTSGSEEGTDYLVWLQLGLYVLVATAIAVIIDQREKGKRELEKALVAERESQARIRAVANNVNEALLLVAPNQQVLDANQRFHEMFGVSLDRVVGRRLSQCLPLLEPVFASPGTLTDSIASRVGDGDGSFKEIVTQRWPRARELELVSTAVRTDDGLLGRLFLFRDVTHEREVDRMKTEFVSLVSHELRTPLTSIKGFTEMVLDGDAGEINEEVTEYLGIVHSNAERLVSLVNDLLDISRIESGRIQLKRAPVDLTRVAATVTATMQHLILAKAQTYTVEIEPAAAWVLGDNDKIIQVLTNYVSNAYKYSPQGADIRVAVSREGTHARIAVADTGMGIAPEDQARLFTRFYRVDNSMTREIGGTGLGLSIVKAIVELQGGWVGVESEVGKGSTFYFTVPITEPPLIQEGAGATPATGATPAVTEERAETPSAPRTFPDAAATEQAPIEHLPAALPAALPAEATILVVEDDPDISRLVSTQLEKAGYDVVTAFSAEEALRLVRSMTPDLITLDLQLPGMDGYDFAGLLAEHPATRHIPILVLSVSGDDASAFHFAAHALSKPYDEDELLEAVADRIETVSGNRILVIEDDENIARLLADVLGQHGFTTLHAADGESGLVLAQNDGVGLILLDLRLPGIDGFMVLQSLKQQPSTAAIPVIAMTGSHATMVGARARVLSLGAVDFLVKPFDLDTLVQEVRILTHAGTPQ